MFSNNQPMRFWLTTHHPHQRPDDAAGWNLYVRRRPAPEPATGGRVLFYETMNAPRGVGTKPGRRGIVRAAEVAGPAQSSDADGWPLMYPCRAHRPFESVIPMERVLAVLDRGNMRVSGGLLELSADQHDRLGKDPRAMDQELDRLPAGAWVNQRNAGKYQDETRRV